MPIESRYPLKVLQEVEPFPPIQNTANPYLTEAAMHADQANQLQGYGYLVDGVGAFTYLGTVAGTAADYEGFSNKYSKDIILRSDNTSSTIYFYDRLTLDPVYAFIRYNASTNFLEFGSNDNDGLGDVVSAQIDRGRIYWEFQDRIQILKPGRGINFLTPSATELGGSAFENKYELRVNEGGVLELWTLSNLSGDLSTLVWSSATSSGLDLRASNLASDLTTTEQDGIKTKLSVVSQDIDYVQVLDNVIDGTPEVLTRVSKKPVLYSVESVSGSNFDLNIHSDSIAPVIYIKNIIGEDLPVSLLDGSGSFFEIPNGCSRQIKKYGTITLLLYARVDTGGGVFSNFYSVSGDLVKDFEIFESPNGTLYKVGVDDTGARTSIAL